MGRRYRSAAPTLATCTLWSKTRATCWLGAPPARRMLATRSKRSSDTWRTRGSPFPPPTQPLRSRAAKMDIHIIEAPNPVNPLAVDQTISLKGYLNDHESREALRAATKALEFNTPVNTGTVNTAIKALN